MNAALLKHVKFQSDDEDGNLLENSDVEEVADDGGEQLREIYATNSKRPPPKPNKSNLVFPYIEKEIFDALSDEVKLKINQQHAYYQNYCAKKELIRVRGEIMLKGTPSKDLNTSQPLFQIILMTLDQIRI